jgi:lysophospholipase L1-like esterase
MSLKKISELPGETPESHVFDNVDCAEISYRVTGDSQMGSGCFSSSGIGFVEEGGSSVIFNGTDEALPLMPYSAGQVLVPWPGSGELVSLANIATGGMRLGVYGNPLGVLRDNRFLGELVSKSLTAPPAPIRGPSVEMLDINPQTLAFSSNGDWLVAETLNGSFVRIARSTHEVLPFAQSFSMPNSDREFASYISISDDGRFVALYNQYFSVFRVYDLDTCNEAAGPPLELPPQHCDYFDYLPYINSQLAVGAIRHVRFINQDLLEFHVNTADEASHKGVYEIAPSGNIGAQIGYLAMGDSYTSGEGAFDYISGTDTGLNKCHLSLWSYPFIMAPSLATDTHSVACSGAVIRDVGSISTAYHGQAQGLESFEDVIADFTPGYIPQHYFASRYQPAVATVSIGGNDIGFGDILKKCVSLHLGISSPNTCFNTYEDRLEVKQLVDRTALRLSDLYLQLRREAPVTRFYVIGYPQVAYKDGECALNVHLNREELGFTEELINYLNSVVSDAASKAGLLFVDISHALDGHRLCEGDSVAVNGLTAGNDAGPFGHESYHPNALGHRLIADFVLASTHNFSLEETGLSGQYDSGQLLEAPSSGRQVSTLEPVTDLVNATVQQGAITNLSLEGMEVGLKPLSAYEVRLDGTPIGTVSTDNAARLNTSVIIPSGAAAGDHFIDLVGENIAGKPTDVSQSIYIMDGSKSGPNILIKINSLSTSG